jgi:hypothetical protein
VEHIWGERKLRDRKLQIRVRFVLDLHGQRLLSSLYIVLTRLHRIALICSGLLIPIAFSLLRFLPLPKRVMAKVYSYLITPATWGDKHRTPLPGNIGQVPTRGQALLIFYFITLNFLLCFATYRLVDVAEQTKYANRERQFGEICANRIAVIALSNIALTVLYSSRNNFLLWITRWPRSTFLLIHHWLGFIVIVETITHALYVYPHSCQTLSFQNWFHLLANLVWILVSTDASSEASLESGKVSLPLENMFKNRTLTFYCHQ